MTSVPRHTDVLIIGARLSGAVVARRLAEADIDIVCLEQREWHDAETYRVRQPDQEARTRPRAGFGAEEPVAEAMNSRKRFRPASEHKQDPSAD